ncbi:zinc-finger homeodomain protein 5-like [Lolium rigidum]|uniref:zinc-finger homeodomain protein 5-like n=1 Tax=Lolium rigidum TaxID=89674 RepID=UPI001F5DA0ED|nr:zinc-finger homeodomain protein 5-like [Lolium rigidum]
MESMVQEDGDWDSGDEGAGAPPAAAIHRGGAAANGMHAEAAAMSQYHECLRNHAAAAGGHVVDGCCEFMATSAEDPLACAACGCHRSFHRRDPSPGRARAHMPLLAASARAPLALLPPPPAAASKNPHHQHQRPPFAYGPVPSGGTGTTTESSSEERHGPLAPAPRKRSRTTFTREQKEQMLAFAERVGWRMQRQDEAAVEHFCAHAGVRRQALKVWMHNNKQSSAGRGQQQPQEEKLQELRQEQQQ